MEENHRAHLLVIVSPQKSYDFKNAINTLIGCQTPDNFTTGIDDVVKTFDDLSPIYIAHYQSKKPSLSDAAVERLSLLVSNPKRILKEATNSISAGIYISHGHNSIYGSDVQNWDEYIDIAQDLPELRLPVESFEQFCLLLDKDDATIKTILDRKTKETIHISPFGLEDPIDLDIYNDINIIFGSKGTGKTEILRALAKHYNNIGYRTEVYESNTQKLDDVYDVKGTSYSININDLGFDDCTEEFAFLKNVTEKNVTSLSAYLRYYSANATNRISRSIKINKINPLDGNSAERAFYEIYHSLNAFEQFKNTFNGNVNLKGIIGSELSLKLTTVIDEIIDKIRQESQKKLLDFRSITLLNTLIQTFVQEISKKTGQPEKPIRTGFLEYASNRIAIEKAVQKICTNLLKPIKSTDKYVGDLGEKGKLYCRTNVQIQDGEFLNSKYTPIRNVNKTPQRFVAGKIKKISKHIYSNTLFEKIAELKAVEGFETISSISDLLLFYRHFTLNDQPYVPSNGESSMVLLYNELTKDKEIYLIDEPEKSLGNDYISEVIVPLMKERVKSGKKLIIATHDANIAVRTLPYNSIYREHDINGYYTYMGNPFSNKLICISGKRHELDWKQISMKTLEGGQIAFGERGRIYGNI